MKKYKITYDRVLVFRETIEIEANSYFEALNTELPDNTDEDSDLFQNRTEIQSISEIV